MHIGRQSGRHTSFRRALVDEEDIDARDPSLINLPIPIPSIPILGPIISPLVGGSQPSSSKTPSSTPTAAPPPPPPSPTSSTPPQSSPTGSGGAPSSGSGSPSGSGSSSSSTGSTGSTGTSGSTGDGDPATPGDGTPAQPSGGSSTNSIDPSSPSSTQSGAASPSGTASTGNTATGNNLSSSDNVGSDGSSSSSGGNTGGEPGTANAGGLPGNSSGGSASGSHSIGSNGLPVTTQANGSGNTSGSGTTSGNNGVAGSSKPHTSTGVIVAIVLVLLLFLAVLALGLRRRHRARRNDRANKWWFTKKPTSQTYGDGDRNSTEILPAAGARSARSSFATTVDHSTTPHNGSFIIPPLPPMAEIGRTDGRTPTLVVDVSHFGEAANEARFSIGSQGSSESQFLVVTHRDSMTTEMAGTPMSVRPFSPSESFAFPKPPDPVGDRTSAYSRPSSTATLSNKSPTISPYTSYGEIIPPIPPAPTFPAPVLVSPNPFGADPVANPFADNNPFEDTQFTPASVPAPVASIPVPVPVPVTVSAPPTVAGAFSDVEYIKRPFNPSLTDELKVLPDDGVRVLQTFDDGWALVEKVSAADGQGDANHGNYGKGLIPIDCLREPGQSLPSFFAVKRVSNYAESTHTVSSESPFAFSAF